MPKVPFLIVLILVTTLVRTEWVISVDHRPFPTVEFATNHHVQANDGLHATRIEDAYLELGKRLIPDFEW